MKRRLAAILAADVVEFSRLMGCDEKGTLGRLKTLFSQIVNPSIRDRGGRVVKLTGDGLLAEFPSVIDAIEASLAILQAASGIDLDRTDDDRIRLRIGIHIGDVIVEGSDIYGDGVNVAARLEALAEPDSICVSEDVFRQARGKLAAGFRDLGMQQLKNIAHPLRAYSIRPDEAPSRSVGKQPTGRDDREPSIAVLPFDNMSADSEQQQQCLL